MDCIADICSTSVTAEYTYISDISNLDARLLTLLTKWGQLLDSPSSHLTVNLSSTRPPSPAPEPCD